jgi:predicted TIM-barrel fold metal-dependent hydrolase
MIDRVLLISSDCHIDFPTMRAKEYLPSKYHDSFDGWLQSGIASLSTVFTMVMGDDPDAAPMEMFTDQGRQAFSAPESSELRLKALEAQGVAAEIVIPNPVGIPFWALPGSRGHADFDARLQNVGLQAYNRWLPEILNPDRQGGLAMIGYEDVEEAVGEIHRAASHAMRGVYLEGQLRGLPPLFDDYYEPIWAAIEEEGLVATFHAGAGFDPEYDAVSSPASFQLMMIESTWFSHRPLWMLIYGGVLERHPDLRVTFTEQYSDWIPGTLRFFDREWAGEGAHRRGLQALCPRPPSEYWQRQCFVGSSIMSRTEVAMRHQIGIDKMMYGTDFAHLEGTWGTTLEHLQALFGAGGVPAEELRSMLGENVARVYGFDVTKLAPVVHRCGFTLDEVLAAPVGELDPRVEATVGRPFRGW